MATTNGMSLASPFVSEWAAEQSQTNRPAQAAPTDRTATVAPLGEAGLALASPFRLSETGFVVGEAGAASSTSVTGAEVYHELRDESFAEALADLVAEATALATEAVVNEAQDATSHRESVERQLAEHFEPLARTAEQMLDGIAAELSARETFGITQTELEQLLEAHTPALASPSFEGFLGGLGRMVSNGLKAVQGVAGAVKNVALGQIASQLKRAVRPLLEAVVKFALNRIPAPMRGVAAQLAQKVLGMLGETPQQLPGELGDGARGEFAGEDEQLDATVPASELEQDLRAHLTALLLAPDEPAREAAVDRFAEEVAEAGEDQLALLQDARERFVERVANLREGESIQPAMEEFLPALLALRPVLSTAISVIGRDRVVGFLAGLISPLLQKFVEPATASQLSRLLVDAGLSLISEAPAQGAQESTPVPQPVARAIAQTVEETVAQMRLDEQTVRDESALATEALEAFERAAATAIPGQLLRPALRNAPGLAGVFEPARRVAYLRYTRKPVVTITPQMADAVTSFGGVKLRSFLRDRYSIKPDQPARVRVHIFQAVPGTSLAAIVAGERRIPGLGPRPRGGMRSAVTKLHPLTRQAAAVLLAEPALGRDLPPRYLANHHQVRTGARYYMLEPLDVTDTGPVPTPRTVPVSLPARDGRAATPAVSGSADHRGRASEVNVTVRLPADEIRLALFISEPRAQEIAKLINQNAPLPVVLRTVQEVARELVATMRTSGPLDHVRVEHETLEAESGLASGALRLLTDQILARLIDWALARIRAFFRAKAREFVQATEDPKYGVTIIVRFRRLPLLAKLREALRGNPLALRGPQLPDAVPDDTDLQIVAGFTR